MRQKADLGRAGIAVGDMLIVLSLLCLVLAVVYPSIRRAAYEGRVDGIVSDVDAVSTSAHRHLERRDAWPEESPSGSIPAELMGALPDDFTPATAHHIMEWHLWERIGEDPAAGPDGSADPGAGAPVEPVESPTRRVTTLQLLAGITVRSDEEALLAALLRRYGQERSFVSGNSWTLILEGAGSGPG